MLALIVLVGQLSVNIINTNYDYMLLMLYCTYVIKYCYIAENVKLHHNKHDNVYCYYIVYSAVTF